MKNIIKQILREGSEKNSLGVAITRPDQKLVIMRGVSGGGKSTKAKSLVAEGVIHSTDDLVAATGDYKGFWDNILKENDYSSLHKLHIKNLANAKESMLNGVSPVVIDNTNLKPSEPKGYVEYALSIGFANSNIIIEDVGTGGMTAEQLAGRNLHNTPLETIKNMIQRHQSHSPLTLAKILEAKEFFKTSDVLYSAVVMDENSHEKLLTRFSDDIPDGWKTFAHHMTIVFGKGLEDKNEVGKEVVLKVTHLGKSDMALAARVEGYPTKNAIPHVTIAINPNGGKPVMSNDITDWEEIKSFFINGVVTELKK